MSVARNEGDSPDCSFDGVDSPESSDFRVEISSSMVRDIRHVLATSGLPRDMLLERFADFAINASLHPFPPPDGLCRNVAGYDELVTLDHPDFLKDVDWQMEHVDDGQSLTWSLKMDVAIEDKLMQMCNDRRIEMDELFRRMMRMGITFFMDKEEYNGHYFVVSGGDREEIGYEYFHKEV